MNKQDLVAYIASYADLSLEQASEALGAVVTGIIDALAADERVVLPGLGVFSVVERISRQVVSEHTGEVISIRPKKIVRFQSACALDEALESASGFLPATELSI